MVSKVRGVNGQKLLTSVTLSQNWNRMNVEVENTNFSTLYNGFDRRQRCAVIVSSHILHARRISRLGCQTQLAPCNKVVVNRVNLPVSLLREVCGTAAANLSVSIINR